LQGGVKYPGERGEGDDGIKHQIGAAAEGGDEALADGRGGRNRMEAEKNNNRMANRSRSARTWRLRPSKKERKR
jgi:hypothetical protein